MTKEIVLVLVAVAILAKFNDVCYFLFVLDYLLQSLDDSNRISSPSSSASSLEITNETLRHYQTYNHLEQVSPNLPESKDVKQTTKTDDNEVNDYVYEKEEDVFSDCTTVVDDQSPTEQQEPITKTKKTRRSKRRRRRRSPKTSDTPIQNGDEKIDYPITDLQLTSDLDIDLELSEIHRPLNISLYSPVTTSHLIFSQPPTPSVHSVSSIKPKLTLQTSNFASASLVPPSTLTSNPISSASSSFSTTSAISSFIPGVSTSLSLGHTAHYQSHQICSPVIVRPCTPLLFKKQQQPLSAIDLFSPFNSPVVAHKITKSTLPWSVPAHMTSVAYA